VHGALAGERHQAGLFSAPGGQGRGPSGRAVEVRDLLATLDHRAVDVASEDGGHLAGYHPDHRLVQQGETVRNATAIQQQPALAGQPHGDQVRVAIAVSVVGDLCGELVSDIELAGVDMPVHEVNQHISALDDVAVDLGQ
jgi:hypothetical protein